MAKATKKVDVKKVSKGMVSERIKAALELEGMKVLDGEKFGFTEGTLVIRLDKCDVQVKMIAPKSGVDHYEMVEEEEEEVEEVEA